MGPQNLEEIKILVFVARAFLSTCGLVTAAAAFRLADERLFVDNLLTKHLNISVRRKP